MKLLLILVPYMDCFLNADGPPVIFADFYFAKRFDSFNPSKPETTKKLVRVILHLKLPGF